MSDRFGMTGNYLIHSAKGTSWEKKDHKYIRKENGKYYYEQNKSLDKELEGLTEKYLSEDQDISLNEFRKKHLSYNDINDRKSAIIGLQQNIKAYNRAKNKNEKEYAEMMIEACLEEIYKKDIKLNQRK